MPIYEYQCANCHHHFDLLQKMSDSPVKQCPTCHQDSAIRLVSAAGFQLKGNGWYATDFKSKPVKDEIKSPDNKTEAVAPTESKQEKPVKKESTD